ncbi:MAG: (2Fe-2S)-binding protein [Rhodospirillales bacterium]|nr:(2Fe-2S)-binding protein [Rhodospirillales bacterium]
MSATPPTFLWNGLPVAVVDGDTIAMALVRAGVIDLGAGVGTKRSRYFCGSGACQNCVVEVKGLGRVEACLTPVVAGMDVAGGRENGDE